jgi:hypothetical protein
MNRFETGAEKLDYEQKGELHSTLANCLKEHSAHFAESAACPHDSYWEGDFWLAPDPAIRRYFCS